MSKYRLSDIFEGDYQVTQDYGERPSYYQQYGFAGHEGVDFATPEGTPIIAPFHGLIIRDVDDARVNAYGIHLVCWDPVQKCAVWYCHLKDNVVLVGEGVTRGQVLGLTGNTGNSTGPHLHIGFVETDQDGNRLNLDNGYKGFLNILDPNLVEWQLGQVQPQPQPSSGSYYPLDDDHKRALDSLEQYRKERLDGPEGNFEGFVRAIEERDRRYSQLAGELSICQSNLKIFQQHVEDTKNTPPVSVYNAPTTVPNGQPEAKDYLPSSQVLQALVEWLKKALKL